MSKLNSLVLFFCILVISSVTEAKTCRKGQPCGGSCISWSKVCHIGSGYNTYSSSSKSQTFSVGNSSVAKPKTYADNEYFVLIDNVYLFKNNSFSSKKLKKLHKNDTVIMQMTLGDWSKVKSANVIGWIKSSYIYKKYK